MIARTLATELQHLFGQSVVVDNRPGANGALGTLMAARAPADGYTLLLTTVSTVAQAPGILTNTNSDAIGSLVPISTLARAPQALLVNAKVPAADYPAFVAWARRQSASVPVAVAGPTDERSLEALTRASGLQFTRVSYRGQVLAMQALLAGEIDVLLGSVSGAMNEYIRENRFKVIGITSASPSPAVPGGVPIARFVPGYEQDINYALWAPGGTPAPIVAKLEAAVHGALGKPGISEKFTGFSVPLALAGPSEVTRILEHEAARLR